jgi:hypothetical protein
MPYLHYETDERREKMANAIKRTQIDQKLPARIERRNSACALTGDDALIEAYLCSLPPLHVRRTLDQFFYHGIDTTKRDRDQVVYRYCKRERIEPRLFMVDQCWLWILGNGMSKFSKITPEFTDRHERTDRDLIPTEVATTKR